jgi:hypothetical protein
VTGSLGISLEPGAAQDCRALPEILYREATDGFAAYRDVILFNSAGVASFGGET